MTPPPHDPHSETIDTPSMASIAAPGPMDVATPISQNVTHVDAIPPLEQEAAKENWPGLKLLMNLIGSAPGIFPPLKVAIDGFSDLVEVFEMASAQNKDYSDLQKKLDSLLEDLSRHLGGMVNPKISNSMINLCTELKSELQLVKQKSKRDSLQRHVEAIDNPGQVLECYQRIKGHLERVMLNANIGMWEAADRIDREARLRYLSPTTSALYDSAKSEEIQRRACTEGTREDELARLLRWANSRDGADVYWMNGMAGTGKTTIAYSLCTELGATGVLGASFFCSRLIPECRDVKLIIPAIAYQLARFSFPYCFALLKVLEVDPDAHTRTLRTQFDRLLAKPLLEVKHTLPTHFVVVVDALDECENENSVGQILDVLLSQTSTFHLPIRFLISSRPEPQIYSRMTGEIGIDHHTCLVLHELDEAKVKRDIETYLKAELEDVGLTPSQLGALAAHSGVLFIYASTAARYIKGGRRIGQHETRLNMILGLVPPSKNGKDRDIDALYISIIKSAFDSRDLDESDQRLMRAVMDTIICAQEPLTIAGLAGLLGLKYQHSLKALLGPLRSVLNVSENSGLVTTLHSSFPEFMRDRERSAPFSCDTQATNACMARACFRVMGTNELRFNICMLDSSYLRDEQVLNLAMRANETVSGELFYACRYWITHLELKGDQDHQGDLVHDFLSKRLLLWMEVLNVKRSMHLGPKIVQQAERWSRAHDCPEDTVALAHDAWRFVTMYTSHAVSQSTPHIYVSMLPFWPDSAPVTRHYTKRMRGAIGLRGSATTRRQLAVLATWPLNGSIWSISFSQDEGLIACAVASSVWIVDGVTGRIVLGPLTHGDRVKDVTFSFNAALIVSCSDDRTVKVWDSNDGRLVFETSAGHTDWINSARFMPDDKRIVSGSRDGTVRVWSLEDGRTILGPIQVQGASVWSIFVSPDGARIASGYNDGTIRIWDAESGEMLLGPLKGHSDRVNSLCFLPDSTRLASGSSDTTLRIWSNLADHQHIDLLKGHTRPVTSIVFSPNGNQLVSGSLDHTVRLWDVQGTPRLARVFTGHTNTIWCVRFSSDGARIVSSSGDRTIRVWDAHSQGPADTRGHTRAITSVAYSRDGTRIVSGSNDGSVYVWDGESGQAAVGPMMRHTDRVRSVCMSPDQSLVASGSKDKTIQLWDTRTGKTLGKPLTGHSGRVLSVCFSPGGTLLASGSEDKTVRLWSAESGEPIGSSLKGHTRWVQSVCFSPDGMKVITGSNDKTILVWDVATGEAILPPFKGHTEEVRAVCASPDGTYIASGSGDTTVRLWDAHSGRSVFGPLQGHTALVLSVSFSPDSSYIVSGSEDKTIRLWDARSGQAVGSPLIGHTDHVRSVAFSPNGRQVVSGSVDLSIRVWDIADLVQPQEPKGGIKNATEQSHAYRSWVLQEDGWVVDPQSRLLAWVPPDLHASLMNLRNPLLISTKGYVRLDLESAKVGERWLECYQP